MAHVARSRADIPRPPLARPSPALLGWSLFGVFVVALLVYGFARTRAPSLRINTPGITLDATPGSIRTYGSIPELLEGRTGPKVALSELPAGSGVVAVGSLSGLTGEIAIVRGVTWVSRPAPDNRMTVERNPTGGESAAVLALADVPHWQSERLDSAVPFERLAELIAERAERHGIAVSRPFPLMIEGTFSDVELNVANGAALGSQKPTEERLHDTAVKVSLASGAGTIVGFFAAHEGERIVHAGKRMHLHVVLPAANEVGHLDSARVEAGSTLLLPAPS